MVLALAGATPAPCSGTEVEPLVAVSGGESRVGRLGWMRGSWLRGGVGVGLSSQRSAPHAEDVAASSAATSARKTGL